MKLVHIIASFGFCSWVAALPSPEIQARSPEANRPDPLCTTTKHTTTSTKKTSTTSTKYSTSSTKKASSTSTKPASSTIKTATSTTSKKSTLTSSSKPTSSTKASSKTLTSPPSVTSETSISFKPSTTSSPAPSSPILSISVSVPISVLPTSLIPSLTSLLPLSTTSVSLPVSSLPVVPVCVPATGEAVTNGGFASGDLTGWTYTNANDPAVYNGYAYKGYGLAADTGNTFAFRHQASEAGTYTLSLSQTLCLIPGVPYTVSFHTGVVVFPNPNMGTGATYALSANSVQLQAPTPYCGAEIPALGTDSYGSCTEPGAGNGYLKNYYEHTTLTYTPTAEEVTFSFQFTYTSDGTANLYANLFDLFSVTQAL